MAAEKAQQDQLKKKSELDAKQQQTADQNKAKLDSTKPVESKTPQKPGEKQQTSKDANVVEMKTVVQTPKSDEDSKLQQQPASKPDPSKVDDKTKQQIDAPTTPQVELDKRAQQEKLNAEANKKGILVEPFIEYAVIAVEAKQLADEKLAKDNGLFTLHNYLLIHILETKRLAAEKAKVESDKKGNLVEKFNICVV